ncbi:MAG: glycogen debranching enzyme N-terminal domain-containing protein [Alphaproteobacteria bacterium]|nr:glycogen debranching enzyme N-terminal domain-containing protein [Alphaproteobacteria bacterium]
MATSARRGLRGPAPGTAEAARLDETRRGVQWWLANGLGGYAAGTIAGTLTRRYHGLLVTPVDPPLERRLIWAKADAELDTGKQSWPLFANRWRGAAISPAGHVNIESFAFDGHNPGLDFCRWPRSHRSADLARFRGQYCLCRLALAAQPRTVDVAVFSCTADDQRPGSPRADRSRRYQSAFAG